MSTQKHCLRWNKHQSNLISAFSSLLTCEALVDVTLAAEDNYLQAHKVVLSACSSYFQTLFTVNPCKHPIVILKDVQFADLKIVVDFMYNGEVNVTQEELPYILKTAELLKIKGLGEMAIDHLVREVDNVADKAELLTPADLNSSAGAPIESSTPYSFSSPRRRKRLRTSSTGSGSCSPERPTVEPQLTGSEFECNVDNTIMKLEPETFTSNASCDSDQMYGCNIEVFKEEITDPASLQLSDHEMGSCVSNSIEATSMEFPIPSTSSHEESFDQEHIAIADADIIGMVNKTTPLNTEKSKKSIWRQFEKFCDLNNYNLDETTTNKELCDILVSWAWNMRKDNGEEYKEYTLKVMWNSVANSLQQLYFDSYNRVLNPFESNEFVLARDARNAKRRQLKLKYKGSANKRRRSLATLTLKELNTILESYDELTPDGLQKKFFNIASVQLAWTGGDSCYSLVHHFREEVRKDGTNSGRIEYNPGFQKNDQGGVSHLAGSKWLVANEKNSNNCPVRLFRQLLNKRGHNIITDRLFLTPNPYWKTSGSWYKNSPIGRNIFSHWTRLIFESIGWVNTKR